MGYNHLSHLTRLAVPPPADEHRFAIERDGDDQRKTADGAIAHDPLSAVEQLARAPEHAARAVRQFAREEPQVEEV